MPKQLKTFSGLRLPIPHLRVKDELQFSDMISGALKTLEIFFLQLITSYQLLVKKNIHAPGIIV